MAGRMCVVPVHVHAEDSVVVYSAGDEIPAEHVALISNPNVWGVDEVNEPPDPAGPLAPPRAGKGSGLDAWVAYAEALGIEVDESATRDDIIAAVDAL